MLAAHALSTRCSGRTRAPSRYYLAQSLPKTERALPAVSSIVNIDNRQIAFYCEVIQISAPAAMTQKNARQPSPASEATMIPTLVAFGPLVGATIGGGAGFAIYAGVGNGAGIGAGPRLCIGA